MTDKNKLKDKISILQLENCKGNSVLRDTQKEVERLRKALTGLLWLIDEGQLIEAEPSHCGPLLVAEAREALVTPD